MATKFKRKIKSIPDGDVELFERPDRYYVVAVPSARSLTLAGEDDEYLAYIFLTDDQGTRLVPQLLAEIYGGDQFVTRDMVIDAVDAIPTERLRELLDVAQHDRDQLDDDADELDEDDEMPYAPDFRREMHRAGMSQDAIERNLAKLRTVRLTPRGTAR